MKINIKLYFINYIFILKMIYEIIKFIFNISVSMSVSFFTAVFLKYTDTKFATPEDVQPDFEYMFFLYMEEKVDKMLEQFDIEYSDEEIENLNKVMLKMDVPEPYGETHMFLKLEKNEIDKNKQQTEITYKDKYNIVYTYYSKSSSIPYKYLDTLCRKLLIDNNMCHFYNFIVKNEKEPEKENEERNSSFEDINKSVDELKDTPDQNPPGIMNNIFSNLLQARIIKRKKIEKNNKDINVFKYGGNLHELNTKMLNQKILPKKQNQKSFI